MISAVIWEIVGLRLRWAGGIGRSSVGETTVSIEPPKPSLRHLCRDRSRSWILGSWCRFGMTTLLKAAMQKCSNISWTHILRTVQTSPQLKASKAILAGCFSQPIKKCNSRWQPGRGGWRWHRLKMHPLKTAYFYGYHLSEAMCIVLCGILSRESVSLNIHRGWSLEIYKNNLRPVFSRKNLMGGLLIIMRLPTKPRKAIDCYRSTGHLQDRSESSSECRCCRGPGIVKPFLRRPCQGTGSKMISMARDVKDVLCSLIVSRRGIAERSLVTLVTWYSFSFCAVLDFTNLFLCLSSFLGQKAMLCENNGSPFTN